MHALPGATRVTHVYSPCQTLPITSHNSGLWVTSLGWIKNTAGCLCRRPYEQPGGNEIKADITSQLNEFFMHGKDILALNNNQQSVLDNFQTWMRQHQGNFTREDQQIIKDYCQELRTIIFPTASDVQREKLEKNVAEIENIADRIFSDICLLVSNPQNKA